MTAEPMNPAPPVISILILGPASLLVNVGDRRVALHPLCCGASRDPLFRRPAPLAKPAAIRPKVPRGVARKELDAGAFFAVITIGLTIKHHVPARPRHAETHI